MMVSLYLKLYIYNCSIFFCLFQAMTVSRLIQFYRFSFYSTEISSNLLCSSQRLFLDSFRPMADSFMNLNQFYRLSCLSTDPFIITIFFLSYYPSRYKRLIFYFCYRFVPNVISSISLVCLFFMFSTFSSSRKSKISLACILFFSLNYLKAFIKLSFQAKLNCSSCCLEESSLVAVFDLLLSSVKSKRELIILESVIFDFNNIIINTIY